MIGFICRCSGSWYKCSNQMQTFRFLSKLLAPMKSKHLMGKILSTTYILSEPVNQCQFVPYRNLYYLEDENSKEWKRYPSAYEVAQDTMKEICDSENPSSPDEWDDVKIEVMSRCLTLTEDNFDSILMHVLLQEGNLQLAQSFMDYLKKRRLKANYVTLCKYMVLCSKNMDRVDQDIILRTYKKIISLLDTSVLGSKVVEFLVQGLCATDEWQKSFDYVNKLSKSELTIGTLNALACAAFRNKDYNLAWDIMTNWYKKSVSPAPEVFVEYMKFVISLHQREPVQAYRYFTNLANYAQGRNIILKEKVVVYIQHYFKRMHECKTSYTKVDRNGMCTSCKRKLEPCTLTEKEFLELRNSFLKYSVQKSDIFINTTASEFQKYCKFVDKFKPFNIVLDGLNVSHSCLETKSKRKLATQLLHVVNHLSKYMNRILVLGRYHMLKEWPKPIVQEIRRKCYLFCVSNISCDDPLLIYAALASGPKTLLVSDDMMRDHMSRLPDSQVQHLFKRWQHSHQVYIQRGENEEKMLLMGPLKHNITIQRNLEKGWHIPFDNEMKQEPYEELNNWLCIQQY